MKYETCYMPIKDFVELKSKMHIFLTQDNDESKKQKPLIKILLVIK